MTSPCNARSVLRREQICSQNGRRAKRVTTSWFIVSFGEPGLNRSRAGNHWVMDGRSPSGFHRSIAMMSQCPSARPDILDVGDGSAGSRDSAGEGSCMGTGIKLDGCEGVLTASRVLGWCIREPTPRIWAI